MEYLAYLGYMYEHDTQLSAIHGLSVYIYRALTKYDERNVFTNSVHRGGKVKNFAQNDVCQNFRLLYLLNNWANFFEGACMATCPKNLKDP